MTRYITIDGNKYAIAQGTYIRKWTRAFTSQLAAGIIRLNFVDRGPGIREYSMTLILTQWDPSSDVYKDGITGTMDQQRQALEASYSKISTPISLIDPYGDVPGLGGVYFTNMNEIIPNYSTVQKPYTLMEISCTEATQVVL